LPTVTQFEFSEVGDQLREAMNRLGLTQYELAKRSGVSRRQIGMAFKGANITLDTLSKIATVLRMQSIRMRDVEIRHDAPIDNDVLKRAGKILNSIHDEAGQVMLLLGSAESREPAAAPVPAPDLPAWGASMPSRGVDRELMERAYELVKAVASAARQVPSDERGGGGQASGSGGR
jgi:transcriptional regulator with XRE-family HTH domain